MENSHAHRKQNGRAAEGRAVDSHEAGDHRRAAARSLSPCSSRTSAGATAQSNPIRTTRQPRARSPSTAGITAGTLTGWHGTTHRRRVRRGLRGWDYVLNCLDRGISSTVFSGDALHALAKKCILQRRRQQTGRHNWELGELSKEEARDLHDIDVLRSIESSSECWHQSALLTELFGEEWHYPLDGQAVEETTNSRICAELSRQCSRRCGEHLL